MEFVAACGSASFPGFLIPECVEAFGRAMTGRLSLPSTFLRRRPGHAPASWRDAASLISNIGGRLARSRAGRVGLRDGGVWTTFGNWFSRNRGRISFFLFQTPSPILAGEAWRRAPR